jgi:hypothetical protein
MEIKEVSGKAQLEEFVRFPFGLYKNHPCWIPPLVKAEMKTLMPETNPVFEHSEVKLFSAWRAGRMAGRIAGIINRMENDFIGEKHARFGWIDFIDDEEVSAALLEAVQLWARSKGMSLLKGPYGFNQLDKNGMLIEGFDTLGTANTIFNYEYYPRHLEKAGFEKDLEWVEAELWLADQVPEKFSRFVEVARERYGMTAFKPKSKADMLRIGDQLFDLLLETYQNLPGFVPISQKQRESYIQRYIRFLKRELVIVVTDKDKQPIGFSVTMPSLSKAYQKANGKLYPFGIIHLLAAIRWNDTADLQLIGVKEEWRKKGAHSLIFLETGNSLIRSGMRRVQINPMLEFNTGVLTLWKDFEHRIYKRRKTVKKTL